MKKFKGFTLVECLVAMAILAVAGTLMASIYATVSQKNNANHFMNTSLANQMKYIEQYTDSETVPIYYGNAAASQPDPEASNSSTTKYPPHKKSVSANYNYVQIKKLQADGVTAVANNTYSFPADVYVMLSRDNSDRNSNNANYSQGIEGANSNLELYDTGARDVAGNPIMAWREKANNTGGREGNDNTSNLRYKYLLGH